MAEDAPKPETPPQTLPPELAYSGRPCVGLAAEDFGNGDRDVLGQTVEDQNTEADVDPVDHSALPKTELVDMLARLRRRVEELEASQARMAESEIALRESEAKYRAIVEHANDAIVVAQDGRIRFANRKTASVSGYSQEELIGRSFEEFLHPDDRELVLMRHQIGMRGEPGQGLIYPFRIVCRNGSTIWVEINPVAITWEGHPATLNLLSDVTERKRAEKTIMHLAYHDALTGLPNRMLFNDRLAVALTQAERNQSRLALMLLDLDDFKEVNDTFGHSVGDELLRRTGERVRDLLRKADTVARIGGDEFMLLLPEISRAEDTEAIAEKVLETVGQPIRLGGRAMNVSVSVGTAVYPDDGESADALMRNVDLAMYHAKDSGGARHCSYSTISAVENVGAR
jgi:diguanylate cyclase (GGDEF)-like protein/PAS domain S-box-containing protein